MLRENLLEKKLSKNITLIENSQKLNKETKIYIQGLLIANYVENKVNQLVETQITNKFNYIFNKFYFKSKLL